MSDRYSPFVLEAFEQELVKIAVAQQYPEFHEFEKVAEQIFYDWHDLPFEHQLLLFEKRANIMAKYVAPAIDAVREGGRRVVNAITGRAPVSASAPVRNASAPARKVRPIDRMRRQRISQASSTTPSAPQRTYGFSGSQRQFDTSAWMTQRNIS